MKTTRRQVLLGISQLAAAAALGACGRSPRQAGASHDDLELLASVAYDILPYPELPAALYVQAARQILESGGADVAAGLENVRQASSGTPWKDLEETIRIDILKSMQDSAFFRTLRGTTLQVLLRDPATYAIVGYGGSAMEHGGYINRGFNDIAWLPAAPKN